MGMWSILEDRDDYGRGFGMRDSAEEAYREGCKHGYEKAMREMQGGGMGFREGGNSGSNYGNRGGYGKRGEYGMGERRMYPPFYPEYPMMGMREDEEMGERRRRRSNGQFY